MRKSRRFSYCYILFVAATLSLSCQRELELQPTPGQDVSTSLTGEIVFTAADANAELLTKSSPAEEKPTISYGMIRPSNGEGHHIANITMRSEPLELLAWENDTQTKADVTGLSSFYVTCVTGSAGSESQSWGNVGFSGSSTFSGGKYWPSSNLGYKFYASNASMSFASGGTTVAASNSTDVVVAYKTDATYYASSNSLSFSHIFGKVGSVTVSPADGFDSSDITDVSITIVPKTGGTYNIRTGSWSSVSTGSATTIANSTPGTKSNDLYLVPDTYTISASWTAKGKEFEGSGDFSVSAGECKIFAITLGGQIEICLPGAFSVGSGKKIYFAAGNLQAVIEGVYPSDASLYTASEWKFAKHQYDFIGNAAGNTTFETGTTVDLFGWVGSGSSAIDCYGLSTSTSTGSWGPYGSSSSGSLKTDWGSIPGVVSEFGTGWKTMSRSEANYLMGSRSNYSSKKGWGSINGIGGLILLPDSWTLPSNCTFYPNNRSVDRNAFTLGASGTTNAWIDMETAGAVFLPACGSRNNKTVTVNNDYPYYWLSTVSGSDQAYGLYINRASSFSSDYEGGTGNSYRYVGHGVRLVRSDYIEPSGGGGGGGDDPPVEIDFKSFGGYFITPAPLSYNGTTFTVKGTDWNQQSYEDAGGLEANSNYFTFVQLGQFFDSRGNSFSTSSGSINNNGSKVTYAGYDDWRMPTRAEFATIISGSSPGKSRTGSTVNGTSGVKYACIDVNDVIPVDSWRAVEGVLVFPDNETITGAALAAVNTTSDYTGLDNSKLNVYLNQGCIFLPTFGEGRGYGSPSWHDSGYTGYVWTATEYDSGDAYYVEVDDGTLRFNDYKDKSCYFLQARLIRKNAPALATFNGLMIAPAPLYYNGSTFTIVDDDWNHSSYNSTYGKNSGSYYFTFVNVGQFFDSRGSSFSTSSGNIRNNGSKVSYGDYDDWRMPTQAEWASITTGTSRTGSTVNGSANGRYAIIQLTGVTHAGSSSPVGVLLFPDDKTITGKTLSGINNTTCTTGVTAAELTTYLNQGCVFLPASGCRANGSWSFGGAGGFYWSASQDTSSNADSLDFSDDSLDPDSAYSKSNRYFMVRLVRSAN